MSEKTVAQSILDRLREIYPATFATERPLKIGIFHDLNMIIQELGPPFTKTGLRRALKSYTYTAEYQAVLKAGAARIDLAGAEVGVVSDSHAAVAEKRLAGIKRHAYYLAKKAKSPATPKQEKAEKPKTATPKAEKPKTATPKAEKPKTATPKAENPKTATPKAEKPTTATPKAEKPKTVVQTPAGTRPLITLKKKV